MNTRTIRQLLTFATFTAVAAMIPYSAEAHHGWADFDAQAEVTLQGTVTDFHFVNPHSVVEFDVSDEKGGVRRWQGEFASPLELTRKGWTASTLETGAKVTVTGHPVKTGAPALHVMSIRLASGQEFKLGGGR